MTGMQGWLARHRAALLGVACAVVLAGCGAEDGPLGTTQSEVRMGSTPVTSPDTRIDEIPTGEPGVDRKQWRAATEPGLSLLGNLTASVIDGRNGPLVLAFASGVTARLERVADLRGQDRAGGQLGDFGALLGVDSRAGVFVYQVMEEQRAASASGGGLCRTDRPTFAAIAEFVDDSGQWVLRIATFRGETRPGPQSTDAPNLCSVYNYVVN
jgi:hypothetical protein